MQRINPNSAIRSGYKFEDLYVLKLCVDWLTNPENLRHLRIQYVPDEIQISRFSIDDIVTINSKNQYCFYQLKYKQHPLKDLWTFEELLDKGLERWIRSFSAINESTGHRGYFITNGHPASDISNCLSNSRIAYSKLRTLFPDITKKLLGQFTARQLNNFFSKFNFSFSHPNKLDFEKQLREKFYYDLKATKDGVNNLMLHIAEQGAERYPKAFTLSEIRSLLSWDNPKPLNQNFDIPFDFEFFDKKQHEFLVKQLQDKQGGIQVIIGKPGTGKSTYLSKLFSLLDSKLFIPVVRHHYHLNPNDSSSRERLNADRVSEAIRAEFKKYKKETLGELSYQNTEHIPLREFIQKIATHFYALNKCFILIIDGLDHVIREGKNEDELRDFLDEILYPQPGLYILFGTQEMAVPYFPNIVFRHCPRNNWIEIKGLKKEGVKKVINKHQDDIQLPDHPDMRQEIVDNLYEKCAGNPLHLRYMLTQLKNIGGIAYGDDLRIIPPYKGEIKEYYEDLWRQLPAISKSICFSIALLDFKLQEEEVFDLASHFTKYPPDIDSAYIGIKHLIKMDLSGISVYHNSFLVFLLNQPELDRQRKPIFKQIRTWLKTCDNEELKWSELVKIEYYLGNDNPLFQLDRNWVIESFLNCRDNSQIEKILDLAAEAAFRKKDYEKVIYYRTLKGYYSNKHYNFFETLDKIWVTSFGLRKNVSIRYPDFEKLNHAQIKEILFALKERDRIHIVPEEAIERFNELFKNRDYNNHSVVESWIDILAGFESRIVKDVYQFIIQARHNGSASSYFNKYCSTLLNNGEELKIRQLLSCKLEEQEKLAIAECLMIHDLQKNEFFWKKHISKLVSKEGETNLFQFYFLLSGKPLSNTHHLSDYVEFPDKIKHHSVHDGKILNLYIDNFYRGFFISLSRKEKKVNDWVNNAPAVWPLSLMTAAFKTALYLGDSVISGRRCELKRVFSFFEVLSDLDFYDDHDIYELRRIVVPELIKLVLQLHTFINIHNGHAKTISKKDCQLLLLNKWLYRDDRMFLVSSQMILLSDVAFQEFRKHETENLPKEIIPFKDKAERLANLAILSKNLNKNKAADQLNKEAAEYIISYGNHKDMTLYSIMRSIEICGQAKSKKSKSYLRRIAPFVYNIGRLTDGDETGSFIYNYGSLLAKFDSNLLYSLYFDAVQKREYNLEEILFSDILETLDTSDAVDNAIAHTAVDKNSYNSLLFLSKQNKEIKNIVQDIQRVFGPIDYTEDRGDNSHFKAKPEKKDKKSYSNIYPQKLWSVVEKIKGSNYYHRKREQSKFILEWASQWMAKKGSAKIEVIKSLQNLFRDRFSEIDAELLDFVYPHAFRIDKDFAFQCITWAHANSSSWSEEYIRNMEESRKRWMWLIRDFPQRKEEFFRKSINYSGWSHHRNSDSFYVPIPKATEFFIDCDRLDVAEKITEYYINTLEILFPNFNAKMPAFITEEKKIDHFSILLQRFQSISSLVRERAGWYLADLLEKDKDGIIHSKFFDWLTSLTLENFLCNGLLIIIKSLKNIDSYSYKHIDISTLGNQLQLRCRMSDLVLTKIAQMLNQPLDINTPFVLSMTRFTPAVSKDKFYKQLGTYLPLAYQDYLDRLQEKSPFSIWELWYNMCQEECDKLDLVETRSDKDYANDGREFMIARNTIFTDILRSTFFRLVDYLKETWVIQMDDLFYYTLKNFQVDISFWEIPLADKPGWWPRFKKIPDIKSNLEDIEFEKVLEKSIFINKNEQVLHLSGAISPVGKHYEDVLEGTIHVVPFACHKGKKTSDAEAIYKQISEQSGFWFPKIPEFTQFGLFDNELEFARAERQIVIEDTEIIPLVSNVFHLNPHMWQYFRWAHHFKILGPHLSNSLSLSTSKEGIHYIQNNKTIAQVADFLGGIRDRAQYHNTIPSGNFLKINKRYLNNFLSSNNLRLAYVVKCRYSIREYSFSDEVRALNVYKIWDGF